MGFFLFHMGLAMGPVKFHFHVPIMGLLTNSDVLSELNPKVLAIPIVTLYHQSHKWESEDTAPAL